MAVNTNYSHFEINQLSREEKSLTLFLIIQGIILISLAAFNALNLLEMTFALYGMGSLLICLTIGIWIAVIKKRQYEIDQAHLGKKRACPEITIPISEQLFQFFNQLELKKKIEICESQAESLKLSLREALVEQNIPIANDDEFIQTLTQFYIKTARSRSEISRQLARLIACLDEEGMLKNGIAKEEMIEKIRAIKFIDISHYELLFRVRNLKDDLVGQAALLLIAEIEQMIEKEGVLHPRISRSEFKSKLDEFCHAANKLKEAKQNENSQNSIHEIFKEISSLIKAYPKKSLIANNVLDKIVEMACMHEKIDWLKNLYDKKLMTFRSFNKAIEYAVQYQSKVCFNFLLNENDKYKIYRNDGFLYSLQNGNEEFVRIFLKNGANVNQKFTAAEYTPLHLAVQGLHLEIVILLVKNGADVNLTDGLGEKPIDRLKSEGVRRLLQKSSDGDIAEKIRKILENPD